MATITIEMPIVNATVNYAYGWTINPALHRHQFRSHYRE